MFNKQTLCIEESVHVLFDETNSLVEIDAEDDDPCEEKFVTHT